MLNIDLNCDMGEGYDSDALILPYITSVNIACGYHAGDMDTMKRTVEAALQNNVVIGAHPSYPDRENFGRKDLVWISLRPEDLPRIIEEQLVVLQEICKEFGTKLHHVKPHGALYNRMVWDECVSDFVSQTIQEFDPALILYGLSESMMQKSAETYGLQYVHEVFADRSYQPDGSLTPRTQANALIEDTNECLRQVMTMIQESKVRTITGEQIPIRAETICLHGDGDHAVEFARAIHVKLRENNITLKPPAKK
jgi:5-oxoprolinase (ATP-hydrolysing) subunit A